MKQTINMQNVATVTVQAALGQSRQVLAATPWNDQSAAMFRSDVENQLPQTVAFNQKLGRNWANLVRLGLHHFKRELFEQDPIWHLRRPATLEDLEPRLLGAVRAAVPEPFEVSVQRDWHPYSAYYLHVTWPVPTDVSVAREPEDVVIPGYYLG